MTVLSPLTDCWGTGCWQDIIGTDSVTGFAWPPQFWGGSTRFQLIAGANTSVTAATISNVLVNQIQTVTGPKGNQTQALYSEIKQREQWTQDPFMVLPAFEQGDLYIRYWLKLQPNLVEIMGTTANDWNWRAFFEWKTAGDYRVIAEVRRDPYLNGGKLFWIVRGDNEANGGLPYQEFWRGENYSVPVPVGQWFKFEVFWHRSSGNDGRVWMAVNGRVIADRYGSNIGVNNARINRIMISQTYSESPTPQYQWVDDVEIWDGFAPDAAPH